MACEDSVLKLTSITSLSDMHKNNFVTFELSKDKTKMHIRLTSFKNYRFSGDEDFVLIERNEETEQLFLAVESSQKSRPS